MPQLEFSPRNQRFFAKFLHEKNHTMRGSITRMSNAVRDARSVWRDEKYRAFSKKLEEAENLLTLMLKTSDKYAEFLEKKANLGERYLNHR